MHVVHGGHVFLIHSGHSRSLCGAVHPDGAREQEEDQAHRQQHQPKMERDVSFHTRPKPAERPGGETCMFYRLQAVI